MTKRHLFASAAAALLLAVAAPAAAAAVPTQAQERPAQVAQTDAMGGACELQDVTIRWGTIEPWRAYVSGSIAKGGWELEGDVVYDMPVFEWQQATGTLAPDHSFEVTASGIVHFEGHNGLLQVTIGNPSLVWNESELIMSLDITATDTSGNPSVSEQGVESVAFASVTAPVLDGDTLTLEADGGALLEGGVRAFGGFYEVGKETDLLTLTATVANCAEAPDGGSTDPDPSEGAGASEAEGEATADPETTTDPEVTSAPTQAPEEGEGSFPVLPVVIGGVAVLIVAGAVVFLVASRKK